MAWVTMNRPDVLNAFNSRLVCGCEHDNLDRRGCMRFVDEDVLRAVKVRGARSGKGAGEVIEEALRRDLGLDLVDRLWARNDLSEEEAAALAVEAQHATRPTQR